MLPCNPFAATPRPGPGLFVSHQRCRQGPAFESALSRSPIPSSPPHPSDLPAKEFQFGFRDLPGYAGATRIDMANLGDCLAIQFENIKNPKHPLSLASRTPRPHQYHRVNRWTRNLWHQSKKLHAASIPWTVRWRERPAPFSMRREESKQTPHASAGFLTRHPNA